LIKVRNPAKSAFFAEKKMDKIYFLSTCDTCKKILKQLPSGVAPVLQDIKKEPVTEAQLDEMHALAGSYEALFSRKAQLYKTLGLKDKALTETDYRAYILEHYTFLNRPVILAGGHLFAGSKPETVAEALSALSGMGRH
jgi:arsenate reductase (glutaredoxin)